MFSKMFATTGQSCAAGLRAGCRVGSCPGPLLTSPSVMLGALEGAFPKGPGMNREG